jgi:hypothetical protein
MYCTSASSVEIDGIPPDFVSCGGRSATRHRSTDLLVLSPLSMVLLLPVLLSPCPVSGTLVLWRPLLRSVGGGGGGRCESPQLALAPQAVSGVLVLL